MPRRARSILGGYVYHVLNRANGRLRLFKKDADFAAFQQVLTEAHERAPLRILGYTLMDNHWHFAVWPKQGSTSKCRTSFAGFRSRTPSVGTRITARPAWATFTKAASSRSRSQPDPRFGIIRSLCEDPLRNLNRL